MTLRTGFIIGLIATVLLQLQPVCSAEAPTRAEVAKMTKPTVALVEVKPRITGSAFCIHPSGVFITNEHVVQTASDVNTVSLVLNAGLKTQQTLRARVVRSDKALDLALLQAVGGGKVPSLTLGSDDQLGELAELIAFGFPFGVALAKPGEYPTVSVNAVNVSSLRTDANRELHRIQLDSNLNPGNSGGPVVDTSGKVVGVVLGGIPGAGINVAIPVRHVRQFIEKPLLVLTPPAISAANRSKLLEFRATAASFAQDANAMELELLLTSPGTPERRVAMKGEEGLYTAQAVAFPGDDTISSIKFTVEFPNGSIVGMAKDKTFKLNNDEVKLSEVRFLRFGKNAVVETGDGRTVTGAIDGLETLAIRVGDQVLDVKLAEASNLKSMTDATANCLRCVLVARIGTREIGRLVETVYIEGTQRASLEAIRDGKFHKPFPSAEATTYLKAVSAPGDYIGQGKTYSYGPASSVVVRGNKKMLSVNVDGWDIRFAPPRGGTLAVGEYADAKRYPFNDDFPGLTFSGHGRGSNRVGGKFVIWELEMEGETVTRLAIDFIHRAEVTGPPLYGMVRYNSTLQ